MEPQEPNGAHAASVASVAIVGLAGRFPGAADLAAWWRNLRDGVESICFFPKEELEESPLTAGLGDHPALVRARGVLDDVEMFDAKFFGYSRRESELMDPQHRVFLECAWEALEDAAIDPAAFAGRIGVFAGCSFNHYLAHHLVSNRHQLGSRRLYQALLENDKDYLATRVSYKLGLTGPSLVVQTACSTSLVAVHLACQSLLNGECDAALAGGVSIRVPQRCGYLFQEDGILAPDGHCRAFDARSAGTVAGNGAGIVVLRRLEDALAAGDPVRAVIRGSAVNNDGAGKVGFTAPSVDGQAEVVAEALSLAGIDAGSIGYVEAHGTGTALGDPVEVSALTRAFRLSTERTGYCALGSVKTNIGHLDAAAGVAGLLKTVLALEHRLIPPSLHFERPNPRIDFAASPFFVVDRPREWRAADGAPRRAGVSSLGIGGTNAHVVVEEAPAAEPSGPSRPWQLLVLSARSPVALETATGRLRDALQAWPGDGSDAAPENAETARARFADLAHTLQVGRRAWQHRRMLVCRNAAEAVEALARPDEPPVRTGAVGPGRRGVAFLFPGQGSQHAGMAAELYRQEATFRDQIDLCRELLRPHLGIDLREVLWPDGGEAEASERLRQTRFAQPALFAVEYALARQWMAWGIAPRAMVGHSLGEYVAACLAGVLSLEDALALVALRGRLMQALPSGVMVSVPLPEAELAPLLGEALSLAAVNAPDRCVAAGPEEAVAALEERLAERGLSGRRLATSHAFHSAAVDAVLGDFRAAMARVALREPEIPYLSNLTGTWVSARQATDREAWVRHLREPVRFAAALDALVGDPDLLLLEVGPGQTLTGLARRHPGRSPRQDAVASLPRVADGGSEVESLLTALGRLWLSGAAVDWQGFARGERRRRMSLPAYPFERQRYWLDPGLGAPDAAGEQAAATAAGAPGAAAEEADDIGLGVPRASASSAVGAADGRDQERPVGVAPDRPAAPAAGLPDPLRGTTLERLAALWQRILGVESPSAHDNYYELGGDSILGLQLAAAAAEQGLRLTLRQVLSHPTLSELAWAVDQAQQQAPDAEDRPRAPEGELVSGERTGRPLTAGLTATGDRAPAGTPGEAPTATALSALRSEPGAPAPLSFAQERFWKRRQQEGQGVVSSLPGLFGLSGPLDLVALRRALAAIVERHEALRTTFREVEGRAVQIVHPSAHLAAELALPLVDLEGLPPASHEAAVRRAVLRDAEIPFDLAAGPLVRLRLFRRTPEEHALAWVVHHIAFDGWSEAVLAAEMTALYTAFRYGAPADLPPLPVQVQDHARWQRHALRQAEIERQRAFWRETLRGAEPLDLAALRPRSDAGRRAGHAALERFEIPADLAHAVQALAAAAGATLFMTLLAAFAAVLSRATGRGDVTVTNLFANRTLPGTEGLIGNFFTSLPLRVQVDGRGGFRGLLARVRAATLAAHENADVLYEEILEETGAAGEDPSSHFRVRFALQNLPSAVAANGSGLKVDSVPVDTGRIRQDFTFFLYRVGDHLIGRLKYDTGVLDADAVAWIRDSFLRLLRHTVADPDRPLDDLPAPRAPAGVPESLSAATVAGA